MLKRIVCASVGVAAWTAIAAGGSPQAELLGSMEVSSFSDFQQRVVDFGATINNPGVSIMAVPAVQNMLTEKFGKFRPNDPMLFLCYVDMAAFRKTLADADDAAGEIVYPVILYPCAEGPDKFLQSHPEAQKKADGTIELEGGNVALYSADGRTCAFAPNAVMAKRALASAPFSKSAGARPLFRLNVTEAGTIALADLHQKLLEEQAKELQMPPQAQKEAAALAALVNSLKKFQMSMGRQQNALLRSFASLTVDVDFDKAGFVVKADAKAKPGALISPAAGFRLPAGALDVAPAGSPLIFAGNTCGAFQGEGQYRSMMGDLASILDTVPACVQDDAKCAAAVKGLCTAGSNLLKAMPVPAATDWFMGALAFGPQQEPYLVGHTTSAQASQVYALSSRFCAAVAASIEKSWPGILSAKDASLTVNWSRLVDVIVEATTPTPKDREEAEEVKKCIIAVVGGSESVLGTEQTSPTTLRTYAWAKGFTPPAAASSGERNFAAALPEVAADRPSGAFYLALYSMARDNILPIAGKVSTKQKDKDEIQALLSAFPPTGANSAIAGASWYDRDGMRFAFRVTKNEIRNIAMAVNAVIAAQAAKSAK